MSMKPIYKAYKKEVDSDGDIILRIVYFDAHIFNNRDTGATQSMDNSFNSIEDAVCNIKKFKEINVGKFGYRSVDFSEDLILLPHITF